MVAVSPEPRVGNEQRWVAAAQVVEGAGSSGPCQGRADSHRLIKGAGSSPSPRPFNGTEDA